MSVLSMLISLCLVRFLQKSTYLSHIASSPGPSQLFNVARLNALFSACNIKSLERPGNEASVHTHVEGGEESI